MTISTAFNLSITLALAVAPPPQSTGTGNVYYVAKTGKDSYSCAQAQSQSTPKLTINGGLSCLSGGDTLLIRAGTYTEIVSSGVGTNMPSGLSWANPTTIASYPLNCSKGTLYGPGPSCEVVIIQPPPGSPENPFGIKGAIQYLIVDGIIVDGTNSPAGVNLVRYDGNPPAVPHFTRLINNEFRNAGCVIISVGGVGNSDHEFSHNKIHGDRNYFDPKYAPQGCHGIYQSEADSVIDSNEIYDMSGWGIHIYSQASSIADNNVVRNNYVHDNAHVGILLGSGHGNIGYNNIVTRNGLGIQLGFSTINPLVYNNTVVGNGACIEVGTASAGSIIKNNICWQNQNSDTIVDYGSGTIQSNNLIGIDPKFVNSAVDDFRLQSGSPAIGAGTSSIATGIMIPFNGSAPDIGALEY